MPEDRKEQTARQAFYLATAVLTVTVLLIAALFGFFSDLITPPFNKGEDPLRYSRTLEELRMPEGQWLSGLPSYASFEIPLPLDVHVKKANVDLNMITDVNENAVASLRVSINGRRVYETTLSTGRKKLTLQFPIEYGLDQGKRLRVAVSLIGAVGGNICIDDEDAGAMVQVLPDSGIQVQLREPVYSVRDAFAMMPTEIKIALPVLKDNKAWMRLAAAIGVHLSHLDYDVSFIPLGELAQIVKRFPDAGIIALGDIQTLVQKGFDTGNSLGESAPKLMTSSVENRLVLGITSTDATEAISVLASNPMLSLASRRGSSPHKLTDLRSSVTDRDVSLNSFGVDSTVQQVRFRRSWTVRYAIPDMPGAEIPERLRVRIRLPEGPSDFVNLVHVELNDNLIGSQRTLSPGDSDMVFELPRSLQRLRNKLLITLQRQRDETGCLEVRFPVQILPDSALLLSSRQANADAEGFIELPRFFNAGMRVLVPSDYAGTEAPETLSVLLPVLAEFLAFGEIPDIDITDPSSDEIPTTPFMAYQYTPAGTDAIVYQPLQYSNGKRIVVDDNGGRVVQDIDLINKAIAVEHVVSRKLIDKKRDVYQTTQGLVVTRSENSPKLIHADFGWENVLVFPDKEEGFEILKDGQIPLREDMRRDNGLLYHLGQ